MPHRIVLISGFIALACASGPRTEWLRADGSLDREQRSKDLSDCAATFGPNPQAPVDNTFRIRECMRSHGWVQTPVMDGDR